MFRLAPLNVRRSLALTLRRLHSDPYRPGKVFSIQHIDIEPAAQRRSIPVPPLEAQTSQDAQHHSSPPPDPVVVVDIKDGRPNRKLTGTRLNLIFMIGSTAILIFNFRRIFKGAKEEMEAAARFIADAPDLAVLQEDEDALVAHLDALARLCLVPDMYEEFARALARRRAEGVLGQEAIAEACMGLHAIIREQPGAIQFRVNTGRLLVSLVGGLKRSEEATPAAADSTDLSEMDPPPLRA
ncbi:hypothetical protein B0H19DRAFT_1116980 [Mycena capillaripes]|nr:hypothetical protein B0H19DRAFT_1116980 [Mycena capillaripes]